MRLLLRTSPLAWLSAGKLPEEGILLCVPSDTVEAEGLPSGGRWPLGGAVGGARSLRRCEAATATFPLPLSWNRCV